jgi:rhodanese-related sulfurtransferase
MKTGRDLINECRARITEVTPEQVMQLQEKGEEIVLLDCRDLPEVNLGRIPGALHVSRGNIETKVEAIIPRDAHVVIYCASGNRSALVADTMQQMGYTNVASMAGGIQLWAQVGGDIE